MEFILFYGYQKFQKEHTDNIVKTIRHSPWPIILLLIGFAFMFFLTIILVLLPQTKDLGWIPVIIALLLCVVTYFYTEHYQIKTSRVKLEEYKEHCRLLYNWLATYSITKKTDIQEIRQRLQDYVYETEVQRKHRQERIDKWMQILIIPLFLTIFTALIKEKTNELTILSYAFICLLFILFVYEIIWIIRCGIEYFEKRETETMKCFVNDLQGILDTQFKHTGGY